MLTVINRFKDGYQLIQPLVEKKKKKLDTTGLKSYTEVTPSWIHSCSRTKCDKNDMTQRILSHIT